LLFHPDKGGQEEDFKNISVAHEVLSNTKKRREYDLTVLASSNNTDGMATRSILVLLERLYSSMKGKEVKFNDVSNTIGNGIPRTRSSASMSTQPTEEKFGMKEENHCKIAINKTMEFLVNMKDAIEEIFNAPMARFAAKMTQMYKLAQSFALNISENDFVKKSF